MIKAIKNFLKDIRNIWSHGEPVEKIIYKKKRKPKKRRKSGTKKRTTKRKYTRKN